MNDIPETTQPDSRPFGWESFRFAVAALLMAAAVTKVFNMGQILTGGGLLGTMPRLVAVIAFEAAAAAYLIVGDRFLSWLLTLVTFATFATSTVYAITTNQSCDCFGEQLNPEAMIILDTVVLLFTVFLRPSRWQVSSQNMIRHLTIIAVVGGLVTSLAVWRYDVLLSHERSRLLVADALVEKSWPLNGKMDSRLSELDSGKWMILIADQNCVHCRHMVAQHFTDPATHRLGERTAFFVFGGSDDRWQFEFDRVTFDQSGDNLLSWPHGKPYVINPAVFLLDNGIVIAAAEGTQCEEFLGSLLSDPEPSTP